MKLPRNFDFEKQYYIAGPMSGYVEFNYPAFESAKLDLIDARVKVQSPHDIPWPTEEVDGEELWQAMMRRALRMLLGCQGIILLKGWTESKGAMVEYNIAAALKMPVYFAHEGRVIPMHNDTELSIEPENGLHS